MSNRLSNLNPDAIVPALRQGTQPARDERAARRPTWFDTLAAHSLQDRQHATLAVAHRGI